MASLAFERGVPAGSGSPLYQHALSVEQFKDGIETAIPLGELADHALVVMRRRLLKPGGIGLNKLVALEFTPVRATVRQVSTEGVAMVDLDWGSHDYQGRHDRHIKREVWYTSGTKPVALAGIGKMEDPRDRVQAYFVPYNRVIKDRLARDTSRDGQLTAFVAGEFSLRNFTHN